MIMKKWTLLLMIVCLTGITLPAMGAMSISKMRQNSRFLTDRMAHELRLTPQQYDDVYEVNYDFINNVRYLMDDVVRGYEYAQERYYDFLDVRNDDLRWILSSAQYRRFLATEHFYRPIYADHNGWQFRVFKVYTNVNFFFFGKPRHYATYCGGHYRTHFNNVSYYKTHYHDRYRHEVYKGNFRFRPDKPASPGNRPGRDFHVAAKPSPKDNRHPNVSSPSRPERPQMRSVKSSVRKDHPQVRTERKEQKSRTDKSRTERKRTGRNQ
ncbi:MAG: hypothetical protein Q4D36_10935 [Bacteroidales bacterium]|nr:hypothetical protein [Bacteroidales bacterium]